MNPATALTISQARSRQVAGSVSTVRSHISRPGIGGLRYGRSICTPVSRPSSLRWVPANHRTVGTNTNSIGMPTQTATNGTATTLRTNNAIPSSARIASASPMNGSASRGTGGAGATCVLDMVFSRWALAGGCSGRQDHHDRGSAPGQWCWTHQQTGRATPPDPGLGAHVFVSPDNEAGWRTLTEAVRQGLTPLRNEDLNATAECVPGRPSKCPGER